MKNFTIAFALLTAIALPCAAGSTITPEAGMWEQTTVMSADGQNWSPAFKSKGCLSPAQAAAWESQVRQQLAAASCNVNSLDLGGGRISGTVTCAGPTPGVINLDGQYTGKSYAIELKGAGNVDAGSGKMPVKSFAKWTGQRLGPC